jgi:hypothetical protein
MEEYPQLFRVVTSCTLPLKFGHQICGAVGTNDCPRCFVSRDSLAESVRCGTWICLSYPVAAWEVPMAGLLT